MTEQPKQRSIEYYGLGQSGYTAGRVDGDPAIGIDVCHLAYRNETDEHAADIDDDRFTGRGSVPLPAEETGSMAA